MTALFILICVFLILPASLLWTVMILIKNRWTLEEKERLSQLHNGNVINVTGDTLSVSLKNDLRKWKEDSKRGKVVIFVSVPVFLICLFTFQMSIYNVSFLLLFGLLTSILCYRAYRARKLLALYEGRNSPDLKLIQ